MIAIIEGCGANIASVQFALKRLGKKALLTADPVIIKSASHVILPGVGFAKNAMLTLQRLQLIETICGLRQPVLGICLGMQLLFDTSAEGNTGGLGIIPGNVDPLPADSGLSIPHMGWNRLQIHAEQSALFDGIEDQSHVYFVHGFAAAVSRHTLASTRYGIPFSAVVQNNNFYGMQFHPERSGETGSIILRNFVSL